MNEDAALKTNNQVSEEVDKIINFAVRKFIEVTDEIISIFEVFDSKFPIKDEFSKVLIKVFSVFMQHLRSCQVLAHAKFFFSFGVLCRSCFDLIIQLTWIMSLDDTTRAKAIKIFLEFEGVEKNEKGKVIYNWPELIDPSFNYRGVALRSGLDQEIIHLPLKLFQRNEDNPSLLKLTIFDYLSKITHWNPRLLHDIIGLNKNNHLGYTDEYLRLSLSGLDAFIVCALTFTNIYCDHFLESKNDQNIHRLKLIRTDFEEYIASLLKPK